MQKRRKKKPKKLVDEVPWLQITVLVTAHPAQGSVHFFLPFFHQLFMKHQHCTRSCVPGDTMYHWWYNGGKKKTIHNSLPPDGSYRLAKKIISRHAKKWPFPPAKCHEGEFHVLVHAASWWAEQPSWKKAWFIWGLKSGQEKERKDAPKIKRSPPGKCLTQWRAEASSHRLTPAPPKASLPNSTPSETTLLTWNWPNWG